MTNAAATVAHYDTLAHLAQELLTKNAKKTGLEKITVEVKDGVARTYPTLIHVKEGFNFRDLSTPAAQEKIAELAESIKNYGVRETIVVFKEGDSYFVENGHRRLAAVDYAIRHLDADIRTVPVRLSPKTSNDADRVFSQFILNSGEPPTILETAGIFARLINLGWTETEVQKKSGYSRTRFNQILEFNALPSALLKLMKESDIEVKPTFVQERFTVNRKDGDKTLRELEFAIGKARENGSDRATNKHLPADAEIGPSGKRTVAYTTATVAAQTAPAPASEAPTDAAPAANDSNDSTPAASPTTDAVPPSELPRQRLQIVAGAPATVAPPTGAAPATNKNNEFRKAVHAFFKNLVIDNFDRKGSIPTFDAGSFESEAQWVIIRESLDL